VFWKPLGNFAISLSSLETKKKELVLDSWKKIIITKIHWRMGTQNSLSLFKGSYYKKMYGGSFKE